MKCFRAIALSMMLAASACGDGGGGGDVDTDASTPTESFALAGWWEVEFQDFSHWTTTTVRFPFKVDQVGALFTICGSSNLGEFAPGTVTVPIGIGGETTLLDLSIIDEDQLVGTLEAEDAVQTITWRRMAASPEGQFTITGSVLGKTVAIQNTNAYGYVANFGDDLSLDLRTPFCRSVEAEDTYDGQGIYGLAFEAALDATVEVGTPYQLGAGLFGFNVSDESDAFRTATAGGPFGNRDIIDATMTFSELSTTEGGLVTGTFAATLREPGNSLTGSFSFTQSSSWVPSYVAPDIDQDNLTFVFSTSTLSLPHANGAQVAQVFTAGDSSDMVRVDLALAQSTEGGALRIGLRPAPSGIPDPSDASELAVVTVADGDLLKAMERRQLDLPERVALSAGETYAITIESTGGEYLLRSISGDPYPQGAVYWRSAAGDTWTADATDRDLSFRTLMLN